MQVTLRRGQVTDLEPLLELWHALMAFHGELDERFRPTPDAREQMRPVMREWLTEPTYHTVVAEREGRLVAFIIGRIGENVPTVEPEFFGYISDMYVAPEYRRRGLGRRLYQAMIEWFEHFGLTVVQVNAAARNPTSQAFWRGLGFESYLDRLWLSISSQD